MPTSIRIAYLSQHRGEYAVRNAVFLPFLHRADFSASQDVTLKVGHTKHTVQFRWDMDNFTNLLNSQLGRGSAHGLQLPPG